MKVVQASTRCSAIYDERLQELKHYYEKTFSRPGTFGFRDRRKALASGSTSLLINSLETVIMSACKNRLKKQKRARAQR